MSYQIKLPALVMYDDNSGQMGIVPAAHEHDFRPQGIEEEHYATTILHDFLEHQPNAFEIWGDPYLDELASNGAFYLLRWEHDPTNSHNEPTLDQDVINIIEDTWGYCLYQDSYYDEIFSTPAPFHLLPNYTEKWHRELSEIFWEPAREIITNPRTLDSYKEDWSYSWDKEDNPPAGIYKQMRRCARDCMIWGYMNFSHHLSQHGVTEYHQLWGLFQSLQRSLAESMKRVLSSMRGFTGVLDEDMQLELWVDYYNREASLVWVNEDEWIRDYLGDEYDNYYGEDDEDEDED